MVKHRKVFWFILIFVFLLTAANFVLAERQLEINYPEIAGFKPETITKDILPNYIKYIFNFAVTASGLVALAILVYAGILYMVSGGSASKIRAAKEKIGQAALGLAILFGSYLILTTINPQLTFINLPELTKINLVSTSTPAVAEKKILSAVEIPIGVLIEQDVNTKKEDKSKKEEGIFAETRLGRIKEAYNKIEINTKLLKQKAENLKILGEDLKKMTDMCECQNTQTKAGLCGNDPKICSISSSFKKPYCDGEPCGGNRPAILAKNNEINLKRKEIFVRLYSGAGEKTAIDQSMKDLYFPDGDQELKAILKADSGDYDLGLLYWQQSLDFEIKDLQRVSGVYLDAQNKINSCPNLLNYPSFVRYKKAINTAAKYEKIQVKAWENAVPSQDNATFYCVEQEINTGMVSSLPAEDIKKQIISPESWNIKEPVVRCSAEITLGNMFEKSNDLVQKILLETQSLLGKNDVVIKATESILKIEDLKTFIDEISSDNCNSGCKPWSEPWKACHWESSEEGDSFEVCEPKSNPCCVINLRPKQVSSDSNSRSPQCTWFITDYTCGGTPGTDKISDPKGQIAGKTPQFGNLLEIAMSTHREIIKTNIPNLQALIEETKKIIDKPEDKKTLVNLEQNRANLKDDFCSNSKIEWENFSAGTAVSEKGFYSCLEAQSMGWKNSCQNKNNYVCCQSTTPATR